MKKFLKNISLFFALAILLVLGVPLLTSHFVQAKGFNTGNTESNLLTLNGKKEFDYLFLGNSHARNFSRNNQHKNLEKNLGGAVLNFGQGRGICGINDQYFYLKYLLREGYQFKHIIHCVSPPYLYDALLNSSTTTFYQEPFSLNVLLQYLRHPAPNKTVRLVHYIKTKWKPDWIKLQPNKSTENIKKLDKIDFAVVEKGFKSAFPKGVREEVFQHNKAILEKCISLAKSNGIKTSLLQTPTLFEAWPGQKRCNKYCDSLALYANTPHIDLSGAIDAPSFFYDHHHLNTAGIKQLLPILKQRLDQNLTSH